MIKKVLILILISFDVYALDLFKAEYEVYRDGKKIGLSSIELTESAPFYILTDKTNGTHGMASFLGFKRHEMTLFSEKNQHFVPESYDMTQKVAFKKRQSEFQIDSENQMAYGSYKGNDWQLNIPAVFSTANLVSLNLFTDICAGKTSALDYPILKEGKIKNYSFKITSQTDDIVEVDKIHSKPSRITKTWLDKKQRCLPVRTYHIEEGEDPIETKLIKVTFNVTATQQDQTDK